jgi:hypothetical protein
MRKTLKALIVTFALWRLIQGNFATWLIRQGGMRHE